MSTAAFLRTMYRNLALATESTNTFHCLNYFPPDNSIIDTHTQVNMPKIGVKLPLVYPHLF